MRAEPPSAALAEASTSDDAQTPRPVQADLTLSNGQQVCLPKGDCACSNAYSQTVCENEANANGGWAGICEAPDGTTYTNTWVSCQASCSATGGDASRRARS